MDRRENEPIANDLKVSDSSGSDRNPLRLPSERLLRRIETSGDLFRSVLDKTATDASLTEKLEISARLSQLLNEDVFVATELEKEPEVQQRRPVVDDVPGFQ